MNFDLLEFQNEVVSEYASVKIPLDTLYGRASVPDLKFSFGKSKLAVCLGRTVTRCFDKLSKWGAETWIKKDDVKKYSAKAIATVSNANVKELLCPLLRQLESSKLMREEELVDVVKIVTSQLTTEENLRKFSITRDKFLFAIMVYEILRIGTANYCAPKT